MSEDGKYLRELYDNVEDLRPKYDQLSPLYKAWVDAVKNARKRIEKYNKRPESERPEKIDFECCRADQNTEKLIIGGTNGVQITFIGPINHGSKDSPRLKVFSKEAGRKQKSSEGLPVWQWEAYAFDLDSGEMCSKIPH